MDSEADLWEPDADSIDVYPNIPMSVEAILSYRQFKENHEIVLGLDLYQNELVIDQLKDTFRKEFRVKSALNVIDITVATPYERIPVKSAKDIFDNLQRPFRRDAGLSDYRPSLRVQFSLREPIYKEGHGYYMNEEQYEKYLREKRSRKETERIRMQRDAQIFEEQMDMRETIVKQGKDIEMLIGQLKELKAQVEECKNHQNQGQNQNMNQIPPSATNCSFCSDAIGEKRYRCTICQSIEICEFCESHDAHWQHPMVRIGGRGGASASGRASSGSDGSGSGSSSLVEFDEMEISEAVEEIHIVD